MAINYRKEIDKLLEKHGYYVYNTQGCVGDGFRGIYVAKVGPNPNGSVDGYVGGQNWKGIYLELLKGIEKYGEITLY